MEKKLLSINASGRRWLRDDALIFIYFSDWPEVQNETGYVALKKFLKGLFEDHVSEESHFGGEREQKVRVTIASLIKIEPNIASDSRADNLLWIRFAFLALRGGVCPSEYFIDDYAQWRYKCSVKDKIVERRRRGDTSDTTKRKSPAIRDPLEKYPLDTFLLSAEIPVEFRSDTTWCLWNNREKRTPEDVVGRKLIDALSEIFNDAAKKRRIKELSRRKLSGRYQCSLSRRDLAEALKKLYGDRLPYESTTIVKAISTFVACPRGRPKQHD